jgi:general secretion pathway protein A
VPRLVNIIAERALLGGYAHDEAQIGERWVDQAAREALAPRLSKLPRPTMAAVVGVGLALAALLFLLWPKAATPPPAAAPVAPAPAPVAEVVPYLPGDALEQRVRLAGSSPQPAWGQLLGLWTVRAHEAALTDAARCPPVLAPGLFCLRGRASLDKLAALGRPSLLRLQSREGDAWAVLLGADAVRVRLWLGGGRFDTDRLALERAWRGEYAAIWRGPAFLAPPPVAGDSGPAVDWIHDRLRDRAGLDTADAGPAILDDASLGALRRVQTAHGLVADGLIGPETLMALSSGDSDGPRLRRVLD